MIRRKDWGDWAWEWRNEVTRHWSKLQCSERKINDWNILGKTKFNLVVHKLIPTYEKKKEKKLMLMLKQIS